MQEGEGLAVETLPVLGKSAATVEPCDGSFDDPTLWQYGEGMQLAAFDDLNDPVARICSGLRGSRPLISGISEDAHNEGKQCSGSPI